VQVTHLCLQGKSNKIGILSSARFWFSTVISKMTLSQPSPQSSGRQSFIRSGLFEIIKKIKLGCLFISFQAANR
jgi:hypothetical protein